MTTDLQRLDLIAAVGAVADGTPLLGETVQQLLAIIVPAFADVASLDVIGPTGEIRRLGARVDLPGGIQMQERLLNRHQGGDLSVGVLRTALSGESQLLTPMPEEVLRAIAADEQDFEMLRSLDIGASIYVPLPARGRTLGVLACSTCGNERTYTAEDLRFAEVLGNRIGLALDNAGLSQTISGLERRLEATLAHISCGVMVREPSGRMVFANAAAAELLGLESVEALFATSSEALMDLFVAHDETGRQLSLDDLPSARALRGERPAPMVVRSVQRSTGRTRWLLHTATPVFDPEGSVSLAVNVAEDITQSKRAELSQRLLGTAGRELSSSLDYEETLRRLAELAVPELADWCGVSIIASGEALEQVAVAHVDPEKVALAQEWGRLYPTRLDNPSGVAQAVRSGQSQFIPEITDEALASLTPTPSQLALVREIGMRSLIIVPLALAGAKPFGTLSLVMAESERTFDPDDLVIAEELGRRAAMAVQNARLYTERSRIARSLQHGLMQPPLPAIPGLQVASLYRPAGDGSVVGGDFYDAFAARGGWLVVIGDVTGHGAEAAALTSLARHTLRTAGRLLDDPIAIIEQLDIGLQERPETSLVTVCCAMLRPREDHVRADVVLAGHPRPYHVHDGHPQAVGVPGPLLGFGEQRTWQTQTIRLCPHDLLVLFTDGVTDTVGAADRFGQHRLADVLRAASDASDAVHSVNAALRRFGRGPQNDDTAILAVQCRPDLSTEAGTSLGSSGASA